MTEVMDHTPREMSLKAVRDILPKETLLELATKSNQQGLRQAFFHGSLIILAATLAEYTFHSQSVYGWYVLGLTIEAFLLSFLFMPLHECTHSTAFRNSTLNSIVGHATGFLCFRPPLHYKYYHFAHHRYTGDAEHDPELHETGTDLKIDGILKYVVYLSGLPFWLDRSSTILRHALKVRLESEHYLRGRAGDRVTCEARVYLLLYIAVALFSYATGSAFLWRVWVLPSLIGQPFLRYYLMAEHTGCQQGHNMLSNTRTTITTPWYRALAWQMPFHAEHHAFPQIPFHALPRLHRHLSKTLAVQSKCHPTGWAGYSGFHAQFVSKLMGIGNQGGGQR
uniref:Fatty acid desaturase domain-containing protein n=1 Tax=Eutreptiella gymnastica TaxID=73025 RepID=A0A7S1JED1_9EUGL|mmetsp:Transcript_89797/g.155535  ORF Transcript_89797/g.155535 Transcript_89797/m.155535 type:complete len:337 (+) Transcript_89797:81-1091(+)